MDPALSRRIEDWIAGGLIIASTAPGMLLLGVSDQPGAPENPIFRFYWLPIYAVTLGMSLWRARSIARAWPAVVLSVLLVGWAALSQGWSILPDVTQRRAFALAMTTLLGLYLGAALTPERLVKLLAICFALLAAGSLVVSLALPRYGLESEVTLAGDWRGLWATKNTLAEFMAMGAMSGISAALLSPKAPWRWLAMAALCFALMLMSRGKTSLLCLVLAVGVMGTLAVFRRGPLAAVVTGFLAGTVVIWGGFAALVSPGLLLTAVGKDATLTGRTDIWAAILRQKPDSPWLGFGFGAFWEKTSPPAQFIRKQTHWLVPSAHNGWMDLLVQVGWVGVALFGVVLAVTVVLVGARSFRLRDGYFCLAFLVVFAMLSLSESVLEQHNNLPWSLFVAVLTIAVLPDWALTSPPLRSGRGEPRSGGGGVSALSG